MNGLVKTPRGDYLIVSKIVRFTVRDSPGYWGHGKVLVVLDNGEQIQTGMFEHDFLKAYWEAQGD